MMAPTAHDIEPLLAELRKISGAFGRDGWEADVDRAHAFVDRLYDVGRLLHQHPELRESDAWRDFRDETAPRLYANGGGLSRYADGIDARLHETFQIGDEWQNIARRRSALAFLTELYRGTEVVDEWNLEPEDLEEILRFRCQSEGFIAPEDIPPGIPRSHWWWWCPNPD
jgi:hypothetical protein